MGKYNKRLTDHQKRKLLEEFYSSDYTMAAFSRINGINEATFRYWRDSPHLNRGIVRKRTDEGKTHVEHLHSEPDEHVSLVRVGSSDSDEQNAIIDIPQNVLVPQPEVNRCDCLIKDTTRISSPIRLSLGKICIELDDGCSAMEFKNIITVLNGVV